MAKHILRVWTDNDSCQYIEMFDDEAIEIIHYKIPITEPKNRTFITP